MSSFACQSEASVEARGRARLRRRRRASAASGKTVGVEACKPDRFASSRNRIFLRLSKAFGRNRPEKRGDFFVHLFSCGIIPLVASAWEGIRMFNGAGAMRSSVEALPYAAARDRQGREHSRDCGWTARSLHAGGAAHGRGVKRPPCPRPPTSTDAGTRASCAQPLYR